LPPVRPTNDGPLEVAAVARRFILAFIAFIALIVPAAFVLALLAAPAKPAALQPPGCERNAPR
jgi:hypothetical protein